MSMHQKPGHTLVHRSIGFLLLASATFASANDKVHVSRFWHNHQPTYWPEWNANDPGGQNSRVQYASDSIRLKPGQNYGGLSPNFHPQNNLEEIFNLVTLVRPGHLKTRKAFMEEFVTRGSPTDPRNRQRG